jgi:hypothetical protein
MHNSVKNQCFASKYGCSWTEVKSSGKLWITAIIVCLLASCDMHKVCKVSVDNLNGAPIALTIFANNVQYEFGNVPARQKKSGLLDFTTIDKTDGEYIILVKQASGQTDSFRHGFFAKGQLSNYMNLTTEGGELRVQIME